MSDSQVMLSSFSASLTHPMIGDCMGECATSTTTITTTADQASATDADHILEEDEMKMSACSSPPPSSISDQKHPAQQQYSRMSNAEFRRIVRSLQKSVDRLKEEHLELFEENMRLRKEWAYYEAAFIAECTGQPLPVRRPAKRRPSIQQSSPAELMERARRSVGQFKEALASIRNGR